MVMPVEYDTDPIGCQQSPDARHGCGGPFRADIEERLVVISDGAGLALAARSCCSQRYCGEVGETPIFVSVGVQADEMPAAGIEAVVIGNVVPIVEVAGPANPIARIHGSRWSGR